MNKIVEYLLNWWVSRPSNILLGESSVAVLPQQWSEISYVNVFGLTLLPILVSILICYTLTHKMGKSFLFRWWKFNIITSILVGIAIFLFLSSKSIPSGNIEAIINWQLPTYIIVNRAIVGFLQSFIYYYILSSVLVKILGGAFSIPKFRTNLAYPFPKLF